MKIFERMRGRQVPSLSVKEETILRLLAERPELYGLEMVDRSGGELKRGTVYVTLSRLEEKKFVTCRQEQRHPEAIGLPRRLYKITALGAEVLQRYEQAAAVFATPVLS